MALVNRAYQGSGNWF